MCHTLCFPSRFLVPLRVTLCMFVWWLMRCLPPLWVCPPHLRRSLASPVVPLLTTSCPFRSLALLSRPSFPWVSVAVSSPGASCWCTPFAAGGGHLFSTGLIGGSLTCQHCTLAGVGVFVGGRLGFMGQPRAFLCLPSARVELPLRCGRGTAAARLVPLTRVCPFSAAPSRYPPCWTNLHCTCPPHIGAFTLVAPCQPACCIAALVLCPFGPPWVRILGILGSLFRGEALFPGPGSLLLALS